MVSDHVNELSRAICRKIDPKVEVVVGVGEPLLRAQRGVLDSMLLLVSAG